jgi:gamma-glutamyltranspeptidase / glutathione hydrolase
VTDTQTLVYHDMTSSLRRATLVIVPIFARHVPFVAIFALLGACRTSSTPDATQVRSTGPGPAGLPKQPPPPAAPPDAASPIAASSDPPTPLRPLRAGKRSTTSRRGMVVAVEAHASKAGVAILEAGGNAADAAVAVAYALAVTHPSAGNVGGGGMALVKVNGHGATCIEFRERAPLGVNQAAFDRMIAQGARGPAAVGVPGTVAGLDTLHDRFGRLPREQVMAPAIELARSGHRIGARQARVLGWAWPTLARDPEAKRIFGRGGRPLPEGALLTQVDLARTLERIAGEGAAGFYKGATASALLEALRPGGIIEAGDLEGYQASVRRPLTFEYRGYTLHTAPPPSAGGIAVAQMLLWREHARAYEHPWLSTEGLHLFAEIARRAHATRRFAVVDPDTALASAPSLDTLLDIGRVETSYPPIDRKQATPSSAVSPLYQDAVRELENTTHFGVVDAEGMAVSLTTTLSASYGARFVAPGLGVVLNNALAAFGTVGEDVPAPGRRMTTSMAPTLIVQGDDAIAVLGSPGGDTIPNTVVRLVMGLVDEGLPLEDVVDAPRMHHGFVPDALRFEGERPVPTSIVAELARRGHTISSKRLTIGDANVIVVDANGAHGYADPREGGLAVGPSAP